MQIFIAERPSEFLAQNGVNAVDDIVNNFHRRINNAQTFYHQRKRRAEEFVVQLDNHALAGFGIINIGGA